MGILAFLHRIAARDGGKKMRLLLNESVPEHGHALHSGSIQVWLLLLSLTGAPAWVLLRLR